MRKALGLFANLRPVRTLLPELRPLAAEARELRGVDILVVRELTGGIYFGRSAAHRDSGVRHLRVQRWRDRARLPRGGASSRWAGASKITSVDKANVLETSRLWREVVDARVRARSSRELKVEHMLVDAAAMHLLEPAGRLRRDRHREHVRRHPHRRGVDARRLAGPAAVGVAGRRRPGPVRTDPRLGARHRGQGHRQSVRHDPQRRDAAAPLLRRPRAAAAVEPAVGGAIRSGARTRDIAGPGARDWLGTTAFTDVVLKNLSAS